MPATNTHAVHVLNSLIETTFDSVNGYKEAAEATENPTYRSMFSEASSQRMELARRLQAEVRTFGGEPEDDQSLLGKAHNKFAELRGKLMGSSDKGLIDEVERGEDVIKAKFRAAAEDGDLPESARTTVSAAFAQIRADHDRISQTKKQAHETPTSASAGTKTGLTGRKPPLPTV